jgi:hypothetical protein
MKMNAGYWKLWHDTKGRFYISAILLCCLTFLTVVPSLNRHRPQPCIAAREGEMTWSARRAIALKKVWLSPTFGPAGTLRKPVIDRPDLLASQIANGDVLASHCDSSQRPNVNYAVDVQLYTMQFVDAVWGGAMPYLMLFIGIMLSVGPPFSGESMEAFSLTFSLPWTRERWLVSKMLIATVLALALIMMMLIVSTIITHFRFLDELNATSRAYGPSAFHVSIWQVLSTVLSAVVGVSLGTAASMYMRNMLSATVLAGIVAYFLVSFDLIQLTSREVVNTYGERYSSLLSHHGFQPMILLVVIGLASLLAVSRLRNIDY